MDQRSRIIKDEAFRLGFVECRISRIESLEEETHWLRQWITDGMHGKMDYLSRNIEKRKDPALLVDHARAVISVAVDYFPETIQSPEFPQIAKYAYGFDYHDVVKSMLYQLLHRINEQIGKVSGRAFVDSAPVMEHAWAVRSGLGWVGKHSLVIHPDYGSYIFLGELIIDLEIEPDEPVANRCGSCTRCMDACPAKAIVAPYVVDARRCLSYLTIEHKDDFEQPVDLHHRLFGCDICQDACPWNKKVQPTKIKQFKPNPAILQKSTTDWLQLSKENFDQLTIGSPLQRAGYEAIKRNATLCNTKK